MVWKWFVATPRGEGGEHPQIVAVSPKHIYLKRGDSLIWSRLDVETKKWENLATIPTATDSTGVLLAYDPKRKLIFHLKAGLTKTLHEYNIAVDEWRLRADAPEKIGGGAIMVWGGEDYPDNLYITRGYAGTAFYQYNIPQNKWTELSPCLEVPDPRATAVRIGKYIYYCTHPYFGRIIRYSIAENLWTEWTKTSLYNTTLVHIKINTTDKLLAMSPHILETFTVPAGVPTIYGWVYSSTLKQYILLGPPFSIDAVKQFEQMGDYLYGITGYGAEGSIFRIQKKILKEIMT